MEIPIYQVDAFTSEIFGGNPAAICILKSWLSDEILQNIAAENNLSETAFLVKKENYYDLKWFTPTVEMDLCGHATLASAQVIFSYIDSDITSVKFKTASGQLEIEKSQDLLSMNFPSRKPAVTEMPEILPDALGLKPNEVFGARDLLAIF